MDKFNFIMPKESQEIMLEDVGMLRNLEKGLRRIFERFKYHEIILSEFEYVDFYKKIYKKINENSIFSFFNSEGELIALRWDYTISIIKYYLTKNIDNKSRFYYFGKVYRNIQKYKGKRCEINQAGIELINEDREKNVSEILNIVKETIDILDISDLKIELSNTKIYERINELTNNDEKFKNILEKRSITEMKNYVKNLRVDKSISKFFVNLPVLIGDIEMLKKVKNEINDNVLTVEISKMIDLYYKMKLPENTIFDLGAIPNMEYYNGIMVKGYCKNSADPIISGGEYNIKFDGICNRKISAMGIAYYLDNILNSKKSEVIVDD